MSKIILLNNILNEVSFKLNKDFDVELFIDILRENLEDGEITKNNLDELIRI